MGAVDDSVTTGRTGPSPSSSTSSGHDGRRSDHATGLRSSNGPGADKADGGEEEGAEGGEEEDGENEEGKGAADGVDGREGGPA